MKRLLLLLLLLPVACWAQTITTLAGGGSAGLGDGGPATDAAFGGPTNGFAFNKRGDIIIADLWNQRLRKVDAISHIITTIAGTGVGGYNGDSIAATAAMLFGPKFVVLDTFGNIYVSESQGQRVRKIDTNGYIYTYAGTGAGSGISEMSGLFSGDSGQATAACFNGPEGLAIDSRGNLYISDAYNHRIRMVNDTSHIITTIVGNGTSVFNGDELPATAVALVFVADITTGPGDMIVMADIGSGANRIRSYNPSTGYVSRMAGIGGTLYNGDGFNADSANMIPYSGFKATSGVLYISDYGNERIRSVSGEMNTIATFAGTGFAGSTGDGGPASAATIFEPAHLAMDACGSLYFADAGNLRIRKIDFDTSCHYGVTGIPGLLTSEIIQVVPNPAHEVVSLYGISSLDQISVCNSFGELVYVSALSGNKNEIEIDLRGWAPGIYILRLRDRTTGALQYRKLVVE